MSTIASINDLFMCPVCFDQYNNPRILLCGHHFCEEPCLRKMLTEGAIPCPICKQITLLESEERIMDLPRPVLVNQLQEKLSTLSGEAAAQSPQERSIVCHSCRLVARKADVYCYQCRKQLCRKCEEKHGKVGSFASHRVVALSPVLFCRTHVEETVLHFCNPCDIGVCSTCLMEEHEGHDHQDIEVLAKTSEHALRMRLKSADQSEGFAKTLIAERQVKIMRGKVIKARDDFWDGIRGIKSAMKEFDGKMEVLARDFHTQSAGALREIDRAEGEIRDSITRQDTARRKVAHLLERASMPELIMATRNMTQFTPLNHGFTEELSLQIPTLNQKMAQIATFMPKLERRLETDTRTITLDYSTKPDSYVAVLTPVLTGEYTVEFDRHLDVSASWKPLSITLDRDKQEIVAIGNVENQELILKTFTYQGDLENLHSLGTEVPASGNIGVDSERGLYLIPCTDGRLMRVTREGEVKDTLKVGEMLFDVSYHQPCDLYAVTEVKAGLALILDASSRRVLCKCGGKKEPDGVYLKFGSQFFVDFVLWSKSLTLVVSDHHNHVIHVFDARGQYVGTHGREGSAEGEFFYPSGACVDPADNLLVCDSMNRRVMGLGAQVGAGAGAEAQVGKSPGLPDGVQEGVPEGAWMCVMGKEELCRDTNADIHAVLMDIKHNVMVAYLDKKEINIFKMAK